MLNEMALARRAMRITELADKMGETKPRIHRHLATLKEMGLVELEQASEKYHLGWRLFQLGEAAGAQFDLRYHAEPYLIKLRDELKQTAVLAIPINDQPMVIATAENIYARICVSVKPGNRPLPHCSVFGRLMLAYSSTESQLSLLSGALPSETEDSLVYPGHRYRHRAAMADIYTNAPSIGKPATRTMVPVGRYCVMRSLCAAQNCSKHSEFKGAEVKISSASTRLIDEPTACNAKSTRSSAAPNCPTMSPANSNCPSLSTGS